MKDKTLGAIAGNQAALYQRMRERETPERRPAVPSDKFSPFGNDLFGDKIQQTTNSVLKEKFLFAPFSVLNTREGLWQERKQAWLSLGIESEVGRGGNLLRMSDTIL